MKTLKIFILFLFVTFSLLLTACSSTSADSSGGDTRIVTDVWGREVEIPAEVSSIIALGSGAPRIASYLGAIPMMVGNEAHDAENFTVLRDYNPVHFDTLSQLPIVGAGGGSGDNNGYAEEIIAVSPDVILAAFSAEAADELFSQTNIPVVCVRYISNNLADETFFSAMRVFAQVIGAQERCEEILSFIEDSKKDLSSRTENIPDSDKLRAYTGAVTFNGRHGFSGTYSSFGPFVAINALNVADRSDEPGYYEADLEKIIMWDPDVIFLDPGNMDMVNEEYSSNPAFFNSLRAVSDDNVYTMPAFNNCGMNITYALMNSYYAGIILFPDEFSDINIAEKSEEILSLFLGVNTYDVMAEGGLYYGSLTIGE